MKRDPVLAQLDFLINGPLKVPRAEEQENGDGVAAVPAPPPPPPLLSPLPPLPAPDPVLAQLDALINGAPAAHAAESVVEAEAEELRGPPGILREFGGVRGWMATRGQRSHATSPKRSTPPTSEYVCTNSPSLDQIALPGKSVAPRTVVNRQ